MTSLGAGKGDSGTREARSKEIKSAPEASELRDFS